VVEDYICGAYVFSWLALKASTFMGVNVISDDLMVNQDEYSAPSTM